MRGEIRTDISYNVYSKDCGMREWNLRYSFENEEKAMGFLKFFQIRHPASECKIEKVKTQAEEIYYEKGWGCSLFE